MRKDIYNSAGLFAQGEEWYKNRQAVQEEMMHPKSAMYYINDIEQVTVEFIRDVIESKKDVHSRLDVYDPLRKWALETISFIFLAQRIHSFSNDPALTEPSQRIMKAIDIIMAEQYKLLHMPPIWFSFPRLFPSYRKFDKNLVILYHLSKQYVNSALEKLDLDNESEQSILAKLLRKNRKTSVFVAEFAQDAMLAGFDTTGVTASFLMYHLASNPEKQQLLYNEICEIVGSNGEPITEAKLKKMRYVKACLQESQRMLPVIVGNARQTQWDFVLSGYQIPKGTFISRVQHASGNNPENFESPNMFLPERWLRNDNSDIDKRTILQFSSLPFGHGARKCVGSRFAQLELYCLTIKMLQKYRLEYQGKPVNYITEFVAKPTRDITIKFINRN